MWAGQGWQDDGETLLTRGSWFTASIRDVERPKHERPWGMYLYLYVLQQESTARKFLRLTWFAVFEYHVHFCCVSSITWCHMTLVDLGDPLCVAIVDLVHNNNPVWFVSAWWIFTRPTINGGPDNEYYQGWERIPVCVSCDPNLSFRVTSASLTKHKMLQGTC